MTPNRFHRPARPRDTQRSRLYAAEQAARHIMREDPIPRGDAPLFITAVYNDRWWRIHAAATGLVYPLTVQCRPQRCTWSFMGPDGVMLLAAQRCYRTVILHELAHYAAGPTAMHGPAFARLFLHLVRRIMGPAYAAALRAEYRRHGVRYTARAAPRAPLRAAADR